MSPSLKKLVGWVIIIVLTIALFLFLQAKHNREWNAKYDPAILTGMTPAEARDRLGAPTFVTDSGAWIYNERGGEALVRFDKDRVVQVKRNTLPDELKR